MVMKRRRKVLKLKPRKKPSKPIGMMRTGKTFRFAFGTRANPKKGRKVFNKRSTILKEAKRRGLTLIK